MTWLEISEEIRRRRRAKVQTRAPAYNKILNAIDPDYLVNYYIEFRYYVNLPETFLLHELCHLYECEPADMGKREFGLTRCDPTTNLLRELYTTGLQCGIDEHEGLPSGANVTHWYNFFPQSGPWWHKELEDYYWDEFLRGYDEGLVLGSDGLLAALVKKTDPP